MSDMREHLKRFQDEMPEHCKAIWATFEETFRESMGIKSGLSLNRFIGEIEGRIHALQSMLVLIDISGGTCGINYNEEQLENSPETIQKLEKELEEKLSLQAEFEEWKKINPVKIYLEKIYLEMIYLEMKEAEE